MSYYKFDYLKMNNKYLLNSMDNKDAPQKSKENSEKKVIVTEPKKKKPRCHFCNKKLKMTELNFKCKCGPNFCLQHASPHSHNCSYNYLKDKQALIQRNNPKMCIQCIEVK